MFLHVKMCGTSFDMRFITKRALRFLLNSTTTPYTCVSIMRNIAISHDDAIEMVATSPSTPRDGVRTTNQTNSSFVFQRPWPLCWPLGQPPAAYCFLRKVRTPQHGVGILLHVKVKISPNHIPGSCFPEFITRFNFILIHVGTNSYREGAIFSI